MVKQQRAFAKVKPEKETNGPKDSSPSISSIQPAQLSSKVTSMRFMQRKAQELSYAARTGEESRASRGLEEAALNAILRSEEGNPLIRYCPGRRSFGGFNKPMEDYGVMQIKDFKRMAKEFVGATKKMNANNHAENVSHGNDSNAGKDVSDKEMAKALGRKTEGDKKPTKKQKIAE
uniref:Uncharacterized protein n=1 Tax=Guillardia theta TaxID=55529 RepID=A0A7S4PB21_GUITH